MSIPKTIFQTWKSRTEIPSNFGYWSRTFVEQNPDYVYRLWDDGDNRSFIADHYPWFLGTYEAFPAEIYRADAVRYFFLFHHGGIYADMDTECLKPLDRLLDLADVVLGRMGPNPMFEHSIPNAVMLSKPGQEFWLLIVSLMMSPGSRARPEYVTGPVALKRAYDLYMRPQAEGEVQDRIGFVRAAMGLAGEGRSERTKIRLLPGNALFPLDWNDRVHDRFVRRPMFKQKRVLDRPTALSLFPNSFMVSYWAHSWEEQDL